MSNERIQEDTVHNQHTGSSSFRCFKFHAISDHQTDTSLVYLIVRVSIDGDSNEAIGLKCSRSDNTQHHAG